MKTATQPNPSDLSASLWMENQAILRQSSEVTVPDTACCFAAELELKEQSGEGSKSAPFKMVARSGQPIEHWFWGKVAHDLAGMRVHKEHLAIDFNHNVDEIIGYANKFDTSSGDLVVSGALTPYKDNDRANEIISKAKAGVPWEASINFSGGGTRYEYIEEGQFTQVNGYQFDGPGIVIREWGLRGIAVTAYGADRNTKTEFTLDRSSFAQRIDRIATARAETSEMSDTSEGARDKAPVEEQNKSVTDTGTAEGALKQETTPAENVDSKPVDASAELAARSKPFRDTFGETEGSKYFALGMTMEDALRTHFKTVNEENAKLKEKLALSDKIGGTGGSDSLSSGDRDKSKPKPLAVPDPA